MRYAIWSAGKTGMKQIEVESAEEALGWVRAHTTMVPVATRRPRSTISFAPFQTYIAVEVAEPGTESA